MHGAYRQTGTQLTDKHARSLQTHMHAAYRQTCTQLTDKHARSLQTNMHAAYRQTCTQLTDKHWGAFSSWANKPEMQAVAQILDSYKHMTNYVRSTAESAHGCEQSVTPAATQRHRGCKKTVLMYNVWLHHWNFSRIFLSKKRFIWSWLSEEWDTINYL